MRAGAQDSSQKRRHLPTDADVFGYNYTVRTDERGGQLPQIFRLRDIDRLDLSRGRLRAMVSRGDAERIGRGLYRRDDLAEVTELDTVATVCARIPDAVVCLLTALCIHGIGM